LILLPKLAAILSQDEAITYLEANHEDFPKVKALTLTALHSIELFDANVIAKMALLAVVFGRETCVQLPKALTIMDVDDQTTVLTWLEKALSCRFGPTMAHWFCVNWR
jgi:hypothetical protein